MKVEVELESMVGYHTLLNEHTQLTNEYKKLFWHEIRVGPNAVAFNPTLGL